MNINVSKKLMRGLFISTLGLVTACSITVVSGCGKSAGTLSKSGEAHMDAMEYDLACADFEQAIKKNPDRAEYYISYGFALLGKGDIDNAIAQFDKAHSDKENDIVYENNKLAYRGRGIALIKALRYEEAETALTSAAAISIKTDVDDDIKKYLALVYTVSGKYDEALQIYTEMLQRTPEDGALLSARGTVYAAKGDKEKATLDFENAIKVNPKELTNYFKEYEFYVSNGDNEAAKGVLERAAGIKGENSKDHFKEGILYYIQGDDDKAVTLMGEALKAGIPEANYYLGRISSRQGDLEGAKVYYKRYQDAVNGNIGIAGWYDGMAECAIKEKDYEGALHYVQEGLVLTDVSFTKKFLYREVELYEEMNDYENALDVAGKYLKLYPDDNTMKKEFTFLNTRVVRKK